ncbi:MAG: glycosyltransferase [Victivallales bacterium]|nr:glycosyltransferase [Victivallales bacterium]
MDKITIITICLNAAERLERCVRSVLAQTHLPDEYFFVDGGSTDGTLQLLDTLCGDLQKAGVSTQVIHQVRHPGEAGIPSAWNQGLAHASGDIIALLNSDDFYAPTALETVLAGFAKGCDLFVGSINLVDAAGRKTGEIHPKCLFWQEIMMAIPHPACFVAKETYDKVGLYDTSYRISADYDFIWRCRKAQMRFLYSQEFLTSMETGGTANSSRALARNETRDIALKYSRIPFLARLAWLLRKITGR